MRLTYIHNLIELHTVYGATLVPCKGDQVFIQEKAYTVHIKAFDYDASTIRVYVRRSAK